MKLLHLPEPTYANQLQAARKLLKEKGREALRNPHARLAALTKWHNDQLLAALNKAAAEVIDNEKTI